MNAVVDHHDGQECEYRVSARPGNSNRTRGFKASNRPKHSRRSGPRQHNGMHRRRRKKIQW